MTHKCFNVHCIYLNVVSSHCLESFSDLRNHSSDHLPVFLSNIYNYIQYILMSVLVQRCRNKDACVCVSLLSLPYGKVFPFAWKKMRNFSSMWIYFADISPGQLVMFLLGGICRVCGGEKKTHWSNLSLWRRDGKEELQDKTELFIDPEGEEAMIQTGAIIFKIERNKIKKKFSVIYCHAHSLCSQYCNEIPSWDVLQLSSNVPRHIKKDWQEDKWGGKNRVNWVEIL